MSGIRLGAALLMAALLLPGALFGGPAGERAPLDVLRHDYAMSYFDPEAHLRLARGLREQGDELVAFFVAETARRTLFEPSAFDRAFAAVFLPPDPFDNSAEAEAELRERLKASPEDPELTMDLADIYISRAEWSRAVPLLERVLEQEPANFVAVAALAEVHRRAGRPETAERLMASFERDHPEHPDVLKSEVQRLLDGAPERAREVLDRALEADPEDARLHLLAGILEHRAENLGGARAAYERAAELAPESAEIQGWVARFFLKALEDEEEAFERYLATYFLDPHFYDTEHAEGRVRTLAWSRAKRRLAEAGSSDEPLTELLESPDPVVVGMALEQMTEQWEDSLVPTMLELLAHDDVTVRWKAMTALREHTGPAHDPTVRDLLDSPDLRVVGLALYLAVERWPEEGVEIAGGFLDHPAQLVRFDAISALMLHGGERGRELVEAYHEAGTEPDDRMRRWLEGQLSREPGRE